MLTLPAHGSRAKGGTYAVDAGPVSVCSPAQASLPQRCGREERVAVATGARGPQPRSGARPGGGGGAAAPGARGLSPRFGLEERGAVVVTSQHWADRSTGGCSSSPREGAGQPLPSLLRTAECEAGSKWTPWETMP